MGVPLMEYGNYARKGLIFTTKNLYETVVHHPFFVCVVFALIYISRNFPFLFSLMLSASPVLICTAILLGTLLFYGQRNIHETEIEIEMKTKYEGISLRNRLPVDASVLDKSDRHFFERFGEGKKDDLDSSLFPRKLDEIRVGGPKKLDDVRVGGGSLDGSSKGRSSFGGESESENEENSVHQEKGEWSVERERERERIGDGEVMADHYAIISKVIGELLDSESDHDKSEADSCDSERGHLDEKNGDESGSDRRESSSPNEDEDDDDGSIDGIMPMLDELHPLLDEEGPQPPQISRAESEAALTETDIHESEALDEDEEDDDDDDDDEDEKEDHTKSIITWTEEDQKNLMEVGNSEMERNQRLERILRRRRNRSMVPEINLMDFENSDFQFHIPPISTSRQNPFDMPNDSAPGSAPSYLQRRNPFDLPFDEDDQDETPEESREDLKASLTRQQPFLRRRDNFNPRPSIFSPIRQERQQLQKLRPFFAAEQTTVDESSYSPFHRQSSGQSSVLETESVNSVEYLDDENLEEADDPDQDQDQASNDQDHVSNDEETADVHASSTLHDDVSSKGPVYDTDTSPTRHQGTQSEAPSSSSQFDDRMEAEHSADDQVQAQETSSTGENATRDSGERERSTP